MSQSTLKTNHSTVTSIDLAHHYTRWGHRDWLLLVVLTSVTLFTFSPVLKCDFVNYDDQIYVTDNPHIQAGLSAEGFWWAWTTMDAANWHPLTWLSLMLDAQLFGQRAWGYHLTNLLLHLANSCILFALLRRLTGATWRSFLVSILFAIHPLHVESVAWVTERKDVLSTFFGFLAIWAYSRYAEAPGVWRYLPVLLGLALSLMAKPMLVTLPFVLLLLDYWPLRRWRSQAVPDTWPFNEIFFPFWLLLEKLPLLALSVGSSVMTVLAQRHGQAFEGLAHLTFPTRLNNALVSYVQYLRQAVWPTDLTVFYSHPGVDLPMWQVAGASLLLLLATGFMLWGGRRWPYLPVGWLWYLGTLVPVIGLVQVGKQVRADRYSYVPLIGIFLIVSWGLAELSQRFRYQRVYACLIGFALICILMQSSRIQCSYWEDSFALWTRALGVTEGHSLAHSNFGSALIKQGKTEEAIWHFREALRLQPDDQMAHSNLGIALMLRGELKQAVYHLREALRLKPDNPEAHNNLAGILIKSGRVPEAAEHLREALRQKPSYSEAHNNLGMILLHWGERQEAIGHFREALRLKPDSTAAAQNLKVALGENRQQKNH